MKNNATILKKIENNEITVGIIGLGYVGLPLAVNFALANLNVLGFEKDEEKINLINRGCNYIQDIDDLDIFQVHKRNRLEATSDFSRIRECDAIIICVPTPLDSFKKPDMSFIEEACICIGRNLKTSTFISLESTTYPTTTEHFILPIIERESGLKHDRDFWLAYSPERVDPGNRTFKTKNTPKVLGSLSKTGQEIGKSLYEKAIEKIHTVSSPRVAEMVKILENTYRLINISLINELALLAGKMEINIWEVIEAAKTKPFGFQAFYPGPGIGGHCIPLDPFYLEHIAKSYNFDLSMIHTAGHINMRMPHYMYIKIATALNKIGKAVNGSKILFVGVAYKSNINDERESPAIEIMDITAYKGGSVDYHDPYIPSIITHEGRKFFSIKLDKSVIESYDCIVITTNHSSSDLKLLKDNSKMIVDLRNAIPEGGENIYKL